MALSVTMTGSGTLGGVLPGWSILESCTPSMPGDSRGSLGGASFRAHAKSDSRFVADNTVNLGTSNGSWLGRINEVSVGARADVSAVGDLQFLRSDRTLPPVWRRDPVTAPFVTLGSGTGLVARLFGPSVDQADGSTYASSFGTSASDVKIVKYDADGAYVLQFGGVTGTGNGQFDATYGAGFSAVDAAGNIWVVDQGNARIQKFSSTGTYITQTGSSGSGNGQFAIGGITGIATDSSNNVFVADETNARIQKFNSSGTYQAQVSTASAVPGALVSLRGLVVDSNGIVYASIPTGNAVVDPAINVYSNALAFVRAMPAISPYNEYNFGYSSMTVDADDYLWAVVLPILPGDSYVYQQFAVQLDPETGGEVSRIYMPDGYGGRLGTRSGLGAYSDPAFRVVSNHFTSDLMAVSFATVDLPNFPLTQPRITPLSTRLPLLSEAIQRYMEECDPALNGWTLDYQGSVDPEVVFPGWAGDVWANLKDLFATYGVEKAEDATTQTVIIRDIGSATTTFTNIEPATTRPVNLTGGRPVDVIYQQPRSGGGVVWDAATENVAVSIATGATATRIFATDNHPAELLRTEPTDLLPLPDGNYYVIDSTGTHVPAATWLTAGGNITLTVGESPGTISAFIQGPASNPTGFTGPYSFATGNEPDDTPALSIVGNGTFCTPATFVRAGSQGQPFNSPFMDTAERVAARGHYPSLQDPNVVLNFIVPTADLPPVGQACGVIFPFEDSRYRILEVQRGNLRSTITAERWVTIGDIDTLWAGQTIGDFDTAWSGYSLGDIQVQPLRTA